MQYRLTYLIIIGIFTFLSPTFSQEFIAPSKLDLKTDSDIIYFDIANSNTNPGILINGEWTALTIQGNRGLLDYEIDKKGKLLLLKNNDGMKLYHVSKKIGFPIRVQNIPLWLSLIPPLTAILLALIFKEVLVSLFMGIWAGSFIAGGLRFGSMFYYFESIFRVVTEYVLESLSNSGHLSVLTFSILIGGMVAIISKNGGMAGVVKSLSKYANSPKSAQFITWLLGVAIFFDDYANTLIVGNTMRSVTDKFRISREKLAYIVDSTAAPVSAIAFITTWIGAELGYIDDGISQIGLEINETPYALFLQSLKFSFYPILTLIFILILIKTGKDYGGMFKAEKRAHDTGQVSSAKTEDEDEPDMEDLTPVKNAPLKWQHATFPVLTVILVTILGLLSTGFESVHGSILDTGTFINGSWGSIWNNIGIVTPTDNPGIMSKLGTLIGSSDSYVALLWASLSGVVVAILITISSRTMSLFDTMHWMTTGFKTMVPALLILTLAWALAITTEQLHTADYLSNLLQGNIHPYALPVIIFILAALIAFSTGSSWSTMAILYPIAIPTTYAVCAASGFEPAQTIDVLLNVIATVLAASVLGDHCSPISDTTILSSLASDCNHIDHVRTQMPYALTVGITSLTCVFLATVIGGTWLMNFLILLAAIGFLYFFVSKFGKTVEVSPN
jgi:Na+/H+ antiporter NhaC